MLKVMREHGDRPEPPETKRQSPDYSGLGAGIFEGLTVLHDRFEAEVTRGYPAAWNEVVQMLEMAWPVTMHGRRGSNGREIETRWEFKREGAPTTLHIMSAIALHDEAEGGDVAAALEELAYSRTRLLPRPALKPIWGVKSYYNREQGRQMYPYVPLAVRLLGYVSRRTTHIYASNDTEMTGVTVLEKENTIMKYGISVIDHWLNQKTNLTPSHENAEDRPVTDLMDLCSDFVEEGITNPQEIIAHIDQNLLERYRQPMRTMDALLARMRSAQPRPLIENCKFETSWRSQNAR